MRAVLIKPYDERHVVSIPETNVLESLQNMVEGYVEGIYKGEYVYLVNEEGRLINLPQNIEGYVGNIVILRYNDEDFESLTDDDLNEFMKGYE